MRKTPYGYLFYAGITIVSFAVLITGLFLLNYSVKMYQNKKYEEVSFASEYYISEIQKEFSEKDSIDLNYIKKFNRIFGEGCGADFVLYDSNGVSIIKPENPLREYVTSDIIELLNNEIYIYCDSKEVSEYEPSMLYGNQFTLSFNDDNIKKYYLIAYISGENIDNFSHGLWIIFILVFIVLFILSVFIFSFISKNADAPVLEIERISKNYAKGDFSEKFGITDKREFDRIYASLNKMADFIESSENTNKNFIANVSHELRTPMTTIGGFVDGILDGVIPKSKQNEYLILVSQEIKRLRILISSMLNMTKFESGTMKPNFKETNITGLVIKTVLMFEKKIEVKKANIIGLDSEKVVIIADENLIEQVIYNLIENAVKFVNEGGDISFGFRKNESECFLSIKNTGDGLTDTEISQVFDRFYKTDSSRGKDATGLGLGLSISKKIIHLHNGQITVKSIHGEYTEFIIKLPVKQ